MAGISGHTAMASENPKFSFAIDLGPWFAIPCKLEFMTPLASKLYEAQPGSKSRVGSHRASQ